MDTHKLTELSNKANTWTQHPVPMMSEHSAHLTSRYTYLLFDFDSAQGQGNDFELEVDKLSFSAECRIWALEVWDTKSPAD